MEFQTAKSALDTQRVAANTMTQNIAESEQKKDKQIFRSAKSRKALTKILSSDLTSEKWILKKKGKRDTKKNIKAAHSKITGQGGLFGGLSRADKAARKAEFETRRIQSLEASQAIASVAAEADLGESMDEQEMISSLAAIDVSKYNIESDADFVLRFAENMKELQRAEMLLDYFKSDEGRELMGQNEELSMKLLWMQSIKEAYMERITIISSPYYVSIRDEDFTPATKRNMEAQLKSGKLSDADKSFYKAYLSYNARKTGERRKDYEFRFDKEQKYPEVRLKAAFYSEVRLNEKMQKGMNTVADRDDSGKLVERFVNSDQFRIMKDHRMLVGGGTPRWLRDQEKTTKEEFIDCVRKMQGKIDELLKAEDRYNQRKREKVQRAAAQGAQNPINGYEANMSEMYRKELEREEFGEEPTKLSMRDRRQMKETSEILNNIIAKVEEGSVSMDTARAWLDRTTGQLRFARYLEEDSTLHRQESESYRKKQLKLSDEEKEEQLNKNIGDLGSIIYKHSKALGTFGYVSVRGAKSDAREKRFMHKDNLDKNRDYLRLQRYYYDDLSGDLEETCKTLGKDVGQVIRIRGSRFQGEQADPAYRITISTDPEMKNASVEELLSFAEEKRILNYMHINIKTGVDGPCNDDITILFSKDLSREVIREFLDGYSERCKEKDDSMLTGDDAMMPGTAMEYKDGISMAPEVPLDMMQWIKEETKELDKYNSKDRMNTDEGMKVTKRLKEKKRPEHLSYDDFIFEQMILSYYIAYDRLVELPNVLGSGAHLAKIELDNGLLRSEMKKVFKELMILNGIDPETMTSLRVRDEVAAEKKKGKKLSLSAVLDELEKKNRSEED